MLVLERSLKVFLSLHCSACFSISCTHFGWSLQRKTWSSHTSCQAFLTLWQNCAFHKCHCECWSEKNSVSTKKQIAIKHTYSALARVRILYSVSRIICHFKRNCWSCFCSSKLSGRVLYECIHCSEDLVSLILGGIPIMFCKIYLQDYFKVWEQRFSLFSVLIIFDDNCEILHYLQLFMWNHFSFVVC